MIFAVTEKGEKMRLIDAEKTAFSKRSLYGLLFERGKDNE